MHVVTNRLIHASSPYLLQHAHNPVDWFPWGEEAFARAGAENKLVLVSIGYSSCHWCHVMERESFTDADLARVMNERFICIKVDREERPDVDHVYMAAIQLMTRRGGWPLNCFTLPDGRPVHGGTYFPPAQWQQVLTALDDLWRTEPDKMIAQADRLQQGLHEMDLVPANAEAPAFRAADAEAIVAILEEGLDGLHGGDDHVPKFPMPNKYAFLLRYAALTGDAALKDHVRLTLDRMAQGGIFDQVGGGFARYSTDERWKVPHFEKMLYDNAQLISLYSQAYQLFKDDDHRDVVRRTIAFAERELMSPDGLFYSALDADSAGEEGLFYVWTQDELAAALADDLAFAKDYYNVNERGLWEHGRYILLRHGSDAAFAREHALDDAGLRERVQRINTRLLDVRAQRERPALDDKALTAWNALMVIGLCDAYEALGEPAYRTMAERAMRALLTSCKRPDGGLWRGRTGGTSIGNGFLDDHAFMLEALLALYQVSFNEELLTEARGLAAYTLEHFHDPASGMFRFTSDLDPPLVARTTEVYDNVMPSSNSAMAKALFTLGHVLDDPAMIAVATRQLNNVHPHMRHHPSSYGNWAQLLLLHVHPCPEITITGPEALERRLEFGKRFIPQRIFLGTTTHSALPLLADRPAGDTTTISVCVDKTCGLPVATVDEALRQLR